MMDYRNCPPLALSIAIHYWTTPGDYDGGNTDHFHSPATSEWIMALIDKGLLVRSNKAGQLYEGNNEALEVYINALCSVPFPTQKWVIPRINDV